MSGEIPLWIEKIVLFILNVDSCLIYYCRYNNIRHLHYRFIVIRFLISWFDVKYMFVLFNIKYCILYFDIVKFELYK